MIFTDRTIIVQKGTSSINDTIILYRGDKGVEIRFTLNEGSPFRFGSGASPNIIEKTEAAYGQLIIKRPNDLPAVFSEIAPTNEGKIVFTITAEMIDEITEVGNYTFQIRLLDESRNSRATLPEVVDGIEIREPIASEDTTNEVGEATVGYALTTAGTTEDAFDSQGNYNKTTWAAGDRITDTKLNKIEDGIDEVNRKVANVNNINDTTASATTTYSSNKIENIKENLSSQIKEKTNEKSGLSGWLRSFELDRNKKICFIGDSTTDGPAGPAQYLYQCLNLYHLNSGDNLDGVTIVDKGSSGNTCLNFINNIPEEKGINTCIAEQADLYVFCYGINDVRLGTTTKEQLKSYIVTAVERLLNETNAYVLLRIPNSLLADDVNNTGWIQPLEKSQEYTDIMWNAYMELKNKWARVDIIDMQTLVFGRTVKTKADNPFMEDCLHPNVDGFYSIARCIADYIGITPKRRTDLVEIAKKTNPTSPYLVYPKVLEGVEYELICEGYFVEMGSFYLDFDINPDIAKQLIKKGDIVKIGDKLAYDLVNPTINAILENTRITGVTFDNYENNKRGMVRVYRRKGKITKSAVFMDSNINGKIVGIFSVEDTIISSISLESTKFISNTISFSLKESKQNVITEIATIDFAVNDMTGVTTWSSANAPSKNYNFLSDAVYYLECTSTSYTGDIMLNMVLSN